MSEAAKTHKLSGDGGGEGRGGCRRPQRPPDLYLFARGGSFQRFPAKEGRKLCCRKPGSIEQVPDVQGDRGTLQQSLIDFNLRIPPLYSPAMPILPGLGLPKPKWGIVRVF